MIPTYQDLPPYNEYEKMGYIELVKIRSIMPPTLPPNVKFDIIGGIIQLLNFKVVFLVLEIDNANIHHANFYGIFTSYTIPGVDQKALRLRLFYFLLTGKHHYGWGNFLEAQLLLRRVAQTVFELILSFF